MAKVCADCVTGQLDQGAPSGEVVKVAGTIDTYLAKAENPTATAMIITDVFGYALPNVRLVADEMARQGITVYIPDFFEGGALPSTTLDLMIDPAPTFWSRVGQTFRLLGNVFSIVLFMGRYKDPRILPLMDKVLESLERDHNVDVKKMGVSGYCWGGRYAVLLAGSDKVACAAGSHPSNVDVEKDVQQITKPCIFVLAENDFAFNEKAVNRAKEIHKERKDVVFKTWEGTQHGFAIRGRTGDPVVKKAREEALQAVIDFFKEHCK